MAKVFDMGRDRPEENWRDMSADAIRDAVRLIKENPPAVTPPAMTANLLGAFDPVNDWRITPYDPGAANWTTQWPSHSSGTFTTPPEAESDEYEEKEGLQQLRDLVASMRQREADRDREEARRAAGRQSLTQAMEEYSRLERQEIHSRRRAPASQVAREFGLPEEVMRRHLEDAKPKPPEPPQALTPPPPRVRRVVRPQQ